MIFICGLYFEFILRIYISNYSTYIRILTLLFVISIIRKIRISKYMNNSNNEIEDDIIKLFSKHHDKNNTNSSTKTSSKAKINKQHIDFNSTNVKNNKREINELRKYDLIKERKHFSLEKENDTEMENDFKNEEELNGYFKSIYKDTLENDSVYCSYLDHFDKMWMNNSKTNITLI